MIPTYHYSVSSSSHPTMMPFDLNEEDHSHTHTHNLFTSTNHNNNNINLSSSSSSLSYPILFNPDNQGGSYCWEQPKHLPSDEDQAEKNIIVPSRGSSWDQPEAEKDENKSGIKLKLWKKGDGGNENHLQAEDGGGSVKWMSSKMRMMRRMMVPDQTSSGKKNKFEEDQTKQQPQSPTLGTDDNSSNNSSNHTNSNITVRVCSDCHTTKTPLWRSGPRGPKSLCNACGIRQRKARRAMMAAAAAEAANGTIPMASEAFDNDVKGKKLHKKEKKKKLKAECDDDDEEPQMKKKRKLGGSKPSSHRGRKKFGFDDLTINLSKNLALQVFPQDEKEAAILLMALSYGMLHGFPSDRYLN